MGDKFSVYPWLQSCKWDSWSSSCRISCMLPSACILKTNNLSASTYTQCKKGNSRLSLSSEPAQNCNYTWCQVFLVWNLFLLWWCRLGYSTEAMRLPHQNNFQWKNIHLCCRSSKRVFQSMYFWMVSLWMGLFRYRREKSRVQCFLELQNSSSKCHHRRGKL